MQPTLIYVYYLLSQYIQVIIISIYVQILLDIYWDNKYKFYFIYKCWDNQFQFFFLKKISIFFTFSNGIDTSLNLYIEREIVVILAHNQS